MKEEYERAVLTWLVGEGEREKGERSIVGGGMGGEKVRLGKRN